MRGSRRSSRRRDRRAKLCMLRQCCRMWHLQRCVCRGGGCVRQQLLVLMLHYIRSPQAIGLLHMCQ